MTTSGSVFSETLQEITSTKLDELSKRRNKYEEIKSSLLTSMQAEKNLLGRLHILSAGVKKCFGIKIDNAGIVMKGHTAFPDVEVELKNLDRFLSQAVYDPSLSNTMLNAWERSLLRHLETQSLKFRYASLYGQLVTEWLTNTEKTENATSEDVAMGEAFVDVDSAQKLKAKEEWEKIVFEPSNVKDSTVWNYLCRTFRLDKSTEKSVHTALHQLQEKTSAFEAELSRPNMFNTTTLGWVIRGLRASKLLTDEKREVLKDFESNDVLLKEIADVLNMRFNALDSWTWNSESSVPLEMRRKITGVYDIHMHEDLLQTIFLQFIGVKWSVFFKGALRGFRQAAGTWKSMRREIPKSDQQRLGYYLGPLQSSSCLHSVRTTIYNRKYFVAHLMDHEVQETENIEGEEEAEGDLSFKRKADQAKLSVREKAGKRPRLASKAARRSAPAPMRFQDMENLIDYSDEEIEDDDDGEDTVRNPMELKQTVLHLLSANMAINTRLHGEMTTIHSVFQDWDALLPHETIRTVLKFFGVSETWLNFFSKFLEAPLRFTDEDKSAPARKRRRGTPTSHVLSDVFGEVTLFCLDFAVNQATGGDVLWRIHDDVWFWSRDHNVAVKAWNAVKEFTTVTGTRINPEKTATVRVSNDQEQVLPINKALPEGEIRWGFLKLSARTGEFEIDQDMVDSHIGELQHQLVNKHGSILGFIHAWNTFAGTFFTSNFGKAANCFGRKHVDNMLSTHERIQRQIFASLAEEDGSGVTSVAEYLKEALKSRFGLTDIPDGYLYFPMEIGGLDLQSPFISLLQIRDEVLESPAELVDKFKTAERNAYDAAHAAFVNGHIKQQRYALDDPKWAPASAHDREVFMSFDEYVRYREYFRFDHHGSGQHLSDVFSQLMKRPGESSLDADSTGVSIALTQLRSQPNLRGITSEWARMEPYWRWVAMMYGPEILERFGSLNIVDSGLLPMGMVAFFKEKRVSWRG
ncbi:hypothetical protein HJFPF1_12481 [Paramyrothecium foliicola]|nr:hypothetical protein HJFPF1_12481 [Paramyrothecium foliicola]